MVRVNSDDTRLTSTDIVLFSLLLMLSRYLYSNVEKLFVKAWVQIDKEKVYQASKYPLKVTYKKSSLKF